MPQLVACRSCLLYAFTDGYLTAVVLALAISVRMYVTPAAVHRPDVADLAHRLPEQKEKHLFGRMKAERERQAKQYR